LRDSQYYSKWPETPPEGKQINNIHIQNLFFDHILLIILIKMATNTQLGLHVVGSQMVESKHFYKKCAVSWRSQLMKMTHWIILTLFSIGLINQTAFTAPNVIFVWTRNWSTITNALKTAATTDVECVWR